MTEIANAQGFDLSIDPVAENLVNRIAPGTKFVGTLESSGGILVQGEFYGDLIIKGGPLVLDEDGVISGRVNCDSYALLAGRVLAPEGAECSELQIAGTAIMSGTFRAKANIVAGSFTTYDGADIDGRIKTAQRS